MNHSNCVLNEKCSVFRGQKDVCMADENVLPSQHLTAEQMLDVIEVQRVGHVPGWACPYFAPWME